MKYNVKQAVSGIQGEMDKASRNQRLGQALGGLASGVQAGAGLDQARTQTAQTRAALTERMSNFQGLADDPNASKLEKLLANESLLKLGLLQANLNPMNISEFGDAFKNIAGSDSLFETLASLERAKMIAGGMSERNAITAKKNETDAETLQRLEDLSNFISKKNQPGNLFQGIGSLFGGVMNKFGMGAQTSPSTFTEADYDDLY